MANPQQPGTQQQFVPLDQRPIGWITIGQFRNLLTKAVFMGVLGGMIALGLLWTVGSYLMTH